MIIFNLLFSLNCDTPAITPLVNPLPDSVSIVILRSLQNLSAGVHSLIISDHEIRLSEFGHYFAAILVSAFTFLNSDIIKDGERAREKMNRETPEHELIEIEYNTIVEDEVSGVNELDLAKTELKAAKKIFNRLNRNVAQRARLLNGESFKPFLYQIGTIYLSFLVILGFERPQNTNVIFLWVLVLIIPAYFIQCAMYLIFFIKTEHNPIRWYERTGFSIAAYLAIFILSFGILVCWPDLNEHIELNLTSKCLCVTHHPAWGICWVLMCKYIIIGLALTIPALPYSILLLRQIFIIPIYQRVYNKRIIQLRVRISKITQLHRRLLQTG